MAFQDIFPDIEQLMAMPQENWEGLVGHLGDFEDFEDFEEEVTRMLQTAPAPAPAATVATTTAGGSGESEDAGGGFQARQERAQQAYFTKDTTPTPEKLKWVPSSLHAACQKPACSLPEACQQPARSLPEACQKPARSLPEACLQPASSEAGWLAGWLAAYACRPPAGVKPSPTAVAHLLLLLLCCVLQGQCGRAQPGAAKAARPYHQDHGGGLCRQPLPGHLHSAPGRRQRRPARQAE